MSPSIVEKVVPGCSVKYAEGGGPDPRCYRVTCDKLSAAPSRVPHSSGRCSAAPRSCTRAIVRNGLTADMFSRYVRLNKIQASAEATVSSIPTLRWRRSTVAV